MPKGVYLRSEKLRESQKRLKNALGKHWKVKDSSRMGVKKGTISGMKGKKHSPASIIKISDGHKGQIPWNKGGTSWSKGKHLSKEHREKIGLANDRGLTPIRLRIRGSLEYKLWRKSVFERDNFTCQKYGIRGGILRPHHINNFADFPELRLAIDNGITLSEKAHREFHKKYGNKNNTKEQLNEFLQL